MVVKPSLVDVQGGKQWQVPYLVGKTRYDQDSADAVVNTVDVVFNKESTDLAQKHKEYHSVVSHALHQLCDTAIEAAQAALLERKEMINKDYTVVDSMKCKGDTPALLPVIMDEAAKARAKLARNKPPGGKMFNEIQDMKDAAKADSRQAGNEAPGESMMAADVVDNDDADAVDKPDVEDFSRGPIAPKYSLVYSYPTEIGDFRNQANISEPSSKAYVSHIKLSIELPQVESVGDLRVDIKQRSVELDYKSLYYLSLSFHYDILVDDASAKFVTTAKRLVLTMPVAKRESPVVVCETPGVVELDDGVVELDDGVDEDVEVSQSGVGQDVDQIHKDWAEKQEKETVAQGELTTSEKECSESRVGNGSKLIEELPDSVDQSRSLPKEQAKTARLEIQFMVKPQITYLETLHIYLLHFPGYEPSQVDLLAGDDKLIVQYRDDHMMRYCLVTAEGRSSFKSVEVEKQCARDYFGFTLQFRNKDEADAARECYKIQTETSESKCEAIFEELTEERLRREEIQRKAQEAIVQEIKHDNEIEGDQANDETVDDKQHEGKQEENVQVPESTVNHEKDDVEAAEEVVNQDGSAPTADHTAALRANKYGWQLLDLECLDAACQLD